MSDRVVTDQTTLYKLCLIKQAILFKKQHFGIFDN